MTGTVLSAGFDSSPVTRHLSMLAIMDAKRFDSTRREIGEYMRGEIQDALDGQKLFDGSAMPQSQRALGRTKLYKTSSKSKGFKKGDVREVGKTLIDKSHLYKSYTYQLVGGGVEVGSALVYAAIHHFGGPTGRASHRFNMVARPVMGMTPAIEKRIGDLLIADIQAAQ